MAEIITRTFELSLGHRFRLYADWVARRERREAEAARVAPATVVAAKGRALRTQAGAAVSERARPAARPSCKFSVRMRHPFSPKMCHGLRPGPLAARGRSGGGGGCSEPWHAARSTIYGSAA